MQISVSRYNMMAVHEVSVTAKIGNRWRFSDLISYFCNWFRASADGAGHIYERFVTFSFTLKLRKFDLLKEM